MNAFTTVSFLSDYGLADEFVGVVKAVIWAICPDVTIVDLTHQIPRHDIRAGGLALARSVQYVLPGVVLGVVDPGVGSDRRAVAVEVGAGPAGNGDGAASILIGPDNGLLAPAAAVAGGAKRAVHLNQTEFHLSSPGPTFAGRDIFAPVVAHLCNGVELMNMGEQIDPITLTPGIIPVPREEDDRLEAEVLWVDHFGNVQLNVDPEQLDPMGDQVVLRRGETTRTAHRVVTYADLKAGQVGLVVDSYGLVSIALNRRSAAEELRLGPGDGVSLAPAE